MSVTLHHGKLEDVLPLLAPSSIDSCVTDPPYELAFMGHGWDRSGVANRAETWGHIFRVLKPGAYLIAFGGTRTHHRMVCAIEDAGFDIRDEFDWVFFTGFPKSANQDGEWRGWGTATKPYKEPICVARKPLIGTVAENLAVHRTGAINIDGCRIEGVGERNVLGRWPAGLIHDGSDEVAACFPDSHGQNGDLVGHARIRVSNGIYGDMGAPPDAPARRDNGSSSRFFFCAKASRADREDGCEGLPERQQDESRKEGNPGGDNPRNRGLEPRKNFHPTVKPTTLMRWLCRLITPPGGTVLDCFMGSGSTGRAAVLDGFDFIGIEMTDDYMPIYRARIAAAERQKAIEDEERRVAGLQGEILL